MIDSHMHINSLLSEDKDLLINEINNNTKIERAINIGLDLKISREINNLSRNNYKLYNSVGIHPLYVDIQKCDELYDLITDKVVAIGEIGLDTLKDNIEMQKKYLIKQIEIANNLYLPIIIHANNTNSEIIKIFKNIIKPKYGCVFHCFQPDFEALDYIINNGMYISFAGRITYKTARKSIEIAKKVPSDLFLIETDSPYISPEPHRGEINKSSNLEYILKKISEIKQMSEEEIDEITSNNAKKLFKKL